MTYIPLPFNTFVFVLVTTESPDISKIAFSAQIIWGHVLLGQKQSVVYNTVLTNIGNGYDPRHSHFIVPAKGVYLLSFNGMNVHAPDLYLEMVKNGDPIAAVYCASATSIMGSQMISRSPWKKVM